MVGCCEFGDVPLINSHPDAGVTDQSQAVGQTLEASVKTTLYVAEITVSSAVKVAIAIGPEFSITCKT